MKFVFLGFATTYTPGLTYQDNLLCNQTLADGHQVTYLSNPEKFVDGVIVDTPPENTILPNGLHLIRLPYVKCGPTFLTKKLRLFRGVYHILEKERPDVIFCHNTQYMPILDTVRYKKNHPEVKLYADTHTAYYNSGTNWLSLHILHKIYYKWLTQKALPYLEKYFYIGESEHVFSREVYGVSEDLMEYYPLGGVLPTQEEYAARRAARRKELGLTDTDRLYVHSGKLEDEKRTEELLRAFAAVEDDHAVLAIIGSIPERMKPVLLPLIDADKRVKYLGWKTGAELQEYLCACDLYCQPGSVSATMQNAICCGCAVMAFPHLPYTKHLDWGNLLWVKTQADVEAVFRALAADASQLDTLKQNSRRCAEELLDYRKLAARLYE